MFYLKIYLSLVLFLSNNIIEGEGRTTIKAPSIDVIKNETKTTANKVILFTKLPLNMSDLTDEEIQIIDENLKIEEILHKEEEENINDTVEEEIKIIKLNLIEMLSLNKSENMTTIKEKLLKMLSKQDENDEEDVLYDVEKMRKFILNLIEILKLNKQYENRNSSDEEKVQNSILMLLSLTLKMQEIIQKMANLIKNVTDYLNQIQYLELEVDKMYNRQLKENKNGINLKRNCESLKYLIQSYSYNVKEEMRDCYETFRKKILSVFDSIIDVKTAITEILESFAKDLAENIPITEHIELTTGKLKYYLEGFQIRMKLFNIIGSVRLKQCSRGIQSKYENEERELENKIKECFPVEDRMFNNSETSEKRESIDNTENREKSLKEEYLKHQYRNRKQFQQYFLKQAMLTDKNNAESETSKPYNLDVIKEEIHRDRVAVRPRSRNIAALYRKMNNIKAEWQNVGQTWKDMVDEHDDDDYYDAAEEQGAPETLRYEEDPRPLHPFVIKYIEESNRDQKRLRGRIRNVMPYYVDL